MRTYRLFLGLCWMAGVFGGCNGKEARLADGVSRPYSYHSLKALSPEELLRYMGRAEQESDQAEIQKPHLPDGFWGMDAKAAALAVVRTNLLHTKTHQIQLAVDDHDGAMPPAVGSLSFSFLSSPCYEAVSQHYFLRFDPRGSYFAFAQSREGGSVFYNHVHNRPAYDLRRCDLPYEEARHFAHTLWWLNRVRSQDGGRAGRNAFMVSTGDGAGSLDFRPDRDGQPFQNQGMIWTGDFATRFAGNYDPEIRLYLVAFLIQDAFPLRLGERWAAQQPTHSHDITARLTTAPVYEVEELGRLKSRIREFLFAFSLEQERVSFAILGAAARAAGEFCDLDQLPRYREILQALAAPATPKQSEGAVSPSILQESRTKAMDELREALTLSVRQLESAADTRALLAWACSKDDGAQWALQRLGALDKQKYVTALVWWLEHYQDDGARHIYEEIARVDPPLARDIAAKLPADQVSALTVSAFVELDKMAEFPDKTARIPALINVALSPQSAWDERQRALHILVPLDEPLRHPDAAIDHALLKLLEAEQATPNDLIAHLGACQALGRRGRIQSFDRILRGLIEKQGEMVQYERLGLLAHLALVNPEELKPRLQEVVQPHLQQTNWNITEVFWAIWAADLRELKPQLERLATSGPDDHENSRANSHGGGEAPADARLHLARKIVAIWNEEDIPTRAKLLLALAKTEEGAFDEPGAHSERRARFEIELKHLAGALTAEGREEVRRFLQSIENPRDGQGAQGSKRPPTLLDELRQGLQL